MSSIAEARKIVNFIQTLPDFQWYRYDHQSYRHMGATIADAGLQAGINYRSVVLPRVKRLIEKWPNANTTSNFLKQSEIWGMQKLLNWSHPEKVGRVTAMAILLRKNGVETEAGLVPWLDDDNNRKALRSVRGVGPKTVDYLWRLSGGASIAIDRHMRSFAFSAGVIPRNYEEMKKIFRYAGDILGIDYSSLDHTIWLYVSRANERRESSIEHPTIETGRGN